MKIKKDEIIGWREGYKDLCHDHVTEPDNALPLTERDFKEGDVCLCDQIGCNTRIY